MSYGGGHLVADGITFDIQGLDSVLRKMAAVSTEVTLKAGRGSASKAMRVVRDAARANAKQIDDPTSAADISKNIAVSTKVYKQLQEIRSRVGVKGGARVNNKDPKDTAHWRFIEFGTSDQPARPFMLPALENNVGKVTDVFVNDLDTNIDRVLAKTR